VSDLADRGASFCPACGSEVQQAQSVNADDGLDDRAQGVYEKAGAHVVIDGSVVSVYIHGDSEAIVADGGITVERDEPDLPQVIEAVLDDAAGGVDRQVLVERVAKLSGATTAAVEDALDAEIRHGRVIDVDGEVRRENNRRFAGRER
jgi:hypothetical protein